MKAGRRRYEPEFKGRVALEALVGVRTIQQIAMACRNQLKVVFETIV
jgi:transposase-like protein